MKFIHHGFTSFLMKFTMVLLQCTVTFNHVVFSADRLQLYKHSLSLNTILNEKQRYNLLIDVVIYYGFTIVKV